MMFKNCSKCKAVQCKKQLKYEKKKKKYVVNIMKK